MEINIYHLIEGAKKAEGLAVIIDVFRAFSLECYLYNMGVSNIIPVGSLDKARQLKMEHPEYVLVGERKGKKCEGFDYGNSPSTITPDVAGKTIVHTTSSGTQGIANAIHADEIITGSLVNAKAIVEYIKKKNPVKVSLVAMGQGGARIAEEDELCAKYIKSLLEGKDDFPIDQELIILKDHGGEHFFHPETQDVFPEADYWLCAKHDIFPFVIQVEVIGKDSFLTHKK